MPVVVSTEEVKLEWTDIAARCVPQANSNPEKRMPGVHLSAVVKYMAESAGILKKSSAVGKLGSVGAREEVDEEVMPLCMVLGMAFEEWVAGLYPGMTWQPGSWLLDAINGSPDGYTVDPEFGVQVEEFKLTWKSIRNRIDILQEKLWLWQIMGYCYLLGAKRARLHVCWVNGIYTPPVPIYMRYVIEFSPEELSRHWALLVKYRDRVQAEVGK